MKFQNSARRFLSIILVFCMVLAIVPQFIITSASAAESSGDNTSVLSRLGFNTDSSQYQAEVEDTSNPFGASNISVITIPELMVSSSSYNTNNTWNQWSRVFGKDNDVFLNEGGNISAGLNDKLLTGTDKGQAVNENLGGVTHLRDVAFDPTGCGRANYIAREMAVISGNQTYLYLRLINAETGAQVGSDHFLCTLPFNFFQHQTGAFVSLAAGDFNGDSKEELAVYVPLFDDLPQVVIYTVNTAPAANQSGFSWYCRYDLANKCELWYYNDYATTSKGEYADHYTRWPAVDIASVRHSSSDPDRTDDLVIAVSPSRNIHKYGAPTWNDGALLYTRVLVASDPMTRDGTKNNDSSAYASLCKMSWDWGQYGVTGSDASNYYETMLFGGAAPADVDGDGYDDIVIAGYRNGDNKVGNSQAHFDKDRYLITYCLYNPATNTYSGPVTGQWADAKTESGFFTVNENLASNDNRVDNVLQPLSVAGFAERGDGYADSIFVNGVVARLDINPPSEYTNVYAPDSKLQSANFDTLITTVYKVPTEKIMGSSVGKNRWTSDPVAGNFNGNALGMEQLVFLYGYKTNSSTSDPKAVYHVISIEQTVSGDPEVTVNKSATGNKEELVSGHLFRYRKEQTAESYYCSASLCTPDVDSDSTIMRFTGERDFYFSDPHVTAVLQAAPYFEDITIEDPTYSYTGSTALSLSKGSGTSLENSFTVSAGVVVGSEINYLVGSDELEISVTAKLGGGFSTESSTQYSTAFSAASGDDGAVLVMTPYIRYYFEMWVPEYTTITEAQYNEYKLTAEALEAKFQYVMDNDIAAYINGSQAYSFTYNGREYPGAYADDASASYRAAKKVAAMDEALAKGIDFNTKVPGQWAATAVSYPKEPRLTITTVTMYDNIALQTDAFDPIRTENGGNILSSTPGEPQSYGNTQPKGWLGGKSIVSKSPSEYIGIPLGSGNTISQEIEVSSESSKKITWGVEYEESFSHTTMGAKVGGKFSLEYEGGNTWTSMDGQTYTGTVAGIPDEQAAYYGFMWQFGTWTSKINDEACLVLGYLVRDVDSRPSTPRDLHVSNVTTDNITLKWQPGSTPGATYEIYRMSDMGEWYQLGTVSDGSMTYTDSQCEPGTAYTYIMRAADAKNRTSVYCSPVTGYTNPEGNVPVITRHPEDVTVTTGGAVFSVGVTSASGTNVGTLNYQWQVHDGTSWKTVSSSVATGIYSDTLTIADPQKSMSGYRFRCYISQMVDNKIKSLYSNSALLSFGRTSTVTALEAPSPASGPAQGVYYTDSLTPQLIPTALEAVISGENTVYSVLVPGEADMDTNTVVPVTPVTDYYLRGTGSDSTESFYHVLSAFSDLLSGASGARVTLDASYIEEITSQLCLADVGAKIPVSILDGTNEASGDITVYGETYSDTPAAEGETAHNYYERYIEDAYNICVCYNVETETVTYYRNFQTEYDELYLTTVYYAGNDPVPDLLAAYTKDIMTDVLTTTANTQSGTAVPLRAVISGGTEVSPGGSVLFSIKNLTTGAETSVTAAVSGGEAAYNWTPTAAGSYSITARYSGDNTFSGSTSVEQSYYAYFGQQKTLGIDAQSGMVYGEEQTLSARLFDQNGPSAVTGVTYTAIGENADFAGISGNTFAPRAAGTYTVVAVYEESGTKYTAKAAITASKAPLTVTAGDQSVNIANIGSFTLNTEAVDISGVKYDDDLSGVFEAKCEYMPAIGTFGISVAYDAASVKLANYSVSTVQGRLAVTATSTAAAVDPARKTFPAAVFGYGQQAAQEFTIQNTGAGQITGLTVSLQKGAASGFEISTALSGTTINTGGTATISVRPKTGLASAAAPYTDTLTITGDNGISLTVDLYFTVTAPGKTVDVDINGNTVSVPLNEDDTLTLALSGSEVRQYADGDGSYDITVPGLDGLTLNIDIPALGDDDLVLKTDFGTIGIPNGTLQALRKAYGDTMRLLIAEDGGFKVALLDSAGNEAPYNDPAHPLIITLQYTLKRGQNSGAVVAVNKNRKIFPFGVYKDGSVKFETAATGTYDVIYNEKEFSDIDGHWALDYMHFVAARELFNGIGDGLFDPDGSMTRAMFTMVLARLDGADLSGYTISRFSDVPAGQWYTASVEWAADKGIVKGVGDNKFDPDAKITREQMAVMLYNYMEYKGYAIPSGAISPFADEADISAWALEAVNAMQKVGIVTGMPGNLYNPRATATRAEVATIFARFIETLAG